MNNRQTEPTHPAPQPRSPTRDDLSSRKREILSINADHVLAHASIGYKLFFADQLIVVIKKNDRLVIIQDIHYIHWLINLDHLQDIKFSAFMEDLAGAVTRFRFLPSVEASARDALGSRQSGMICPTRANSWPP